MVRAWREFCSQLYHVVLCQCTLSLQEEICAHADHEAAINNDIELLFIIYSILHSVDGTGRSNLAKSYCEIKEMWFAMKQGGNQSVQTWHDRVHNGVNILKDLNIKVMWFAMKQGCNQSVQKWHNRVHNGVNVLKVLNIKVADEAIVNQVTTANG